MTYASSDNYEFNKIVKTEDKEENNEAVEIDNTLEEGVNDAQDDALEEEND